MIYPLFSIKDQKVGFIAPTLDQNEASAIRNFAYAVNNGGIMNYSSNDFDLYKVGEFDDEKGIINNMNPVFVCSGSSVFGDKDK